MAHGDNKDSEKEGTQAPLKDISTEFQSFIEKGIKSLEDHREVEVAKLKYGDETKGVVFSFAGVTETNKQNRTYPEITIKLGDGETSKKFTWTAKWSVAVDEEKDTIQFKFRDLNENGTSWAFCTLDEEEGELRKVSALKPPKPNKANSEFLEFWFSENIKDGVSIKRDGSVFDNGVFYDPFGGDRELRHLSFPEFPSINDNSLEEDENEDKEEKWAKFFITVMCWRFIILFGAGDDDNDILNTENSEEEKGGLSRADLAEFLPGLDDYVPKRPVDINPHDLFETIQTGQDPLQVPWHVVTAASAALNAGKHLIFTGPPGCGKTHIASKIAKNASKKPPLMVTASQAWTTDEVIGRYMPNLDGSGLGFKEGFFLKALKEERWLIIDEINRCDIDNCFGELFTVLSGQNVTLPFEKPNPDNENKLEFIQLVVKKQETEDNFESLQIQCRRNFRLLATMNDSDIANLNQLSYALRRRFAIIRVDAPGLGTRKTIFQDHINKTYEEELSFVKQGDRLYHVSRATQDRQNFPIQLAEKVNALFAKGGGKDLIELRVVGIAPVKDIIRFVGEGLRLPGNSKSDIKYQKEGNDPTTATEAAKELLYSFLAMGIVLNVFPQLDAVTGEVDRFKNALTCILDAFDEKEYFWYIDQSDADDGNKLSLKLSLSKQVTIRKYLVYELERQYITDSAILKLITDTTKNKIAENKAASQVG